MIYNRIEDRLYKENRAEEMRLAWLRNHPVSGPRGNIRPVPPKGYDSLSPVEARNSMTGIPLHFCENI